MILSHPFCKRFWVLSERQAKKKIIIAFVWAVSGLVTVMPMKPAKPRVRENC